ncbi:ARF GTPase activating protein [Entamoeba marina]
MASPIDTLSNRENFNDSIFCQLLEFKTHLKSVYKSLSKAINTLNQVNFENVSNQLSILNNNSMQGTQIHESVNVFIVEFSSLQVKMKTGIEGIMTECLDPLSKFIHYDFRDVMILKKQYDECSEKLRKEKRPTKYEKIKLKLDEINNIFQNKLGELIIKQETKALQYLSKFWVHWNVLSGEHCAALQQVNTICEKNKQRSRVIGGEKEGYLLWKKSFVWMSNYCVVKNGKLLRYDMFDHHETYDLMLCSAEKYQPKKGLSKDKYEESVEKSKCRFVINVGRKKIKRIKIQTSSPEDLDEWLNAIYKETESAFASSTKSKSKSISNLLETQPTSVMSIISSIQGNDKCCDCGSHSADWGVIERGIVVCAACAGIHRKIGRHVQSLVLDETMWNGEVLQMFSELGNDKVNQILLENASPQQTNQMINIHDDNMSYRESIIMTKHVDLAFINKRSCKSLLTKQKSCKMDCMDVMKLMLLNQCDFKHLIQTSNLTGIILLVLNNYPFDGGEYGWLPLLCAAWLNKPRIISFLLRNGIDGKQQDILGNDSITLAKYNNSKEALSVLLGVTKYTNTIDDFLQGNIIEESIQTILNNPSLPLIPPTNKLDKKQKVSPQTIADLSVTSNSPSKDDLIRTSTPRTVVDTSKHNATTSVCIENFVFDPK